MNKAIYIQEISDSIETLDPKTLKHLLSYIKYIKFQDQIEPTLEILCDSEMLNKVRKGIKEIERGEVLDWDKIK